MPRKTKDQNEVNNEKKSKTSKVETTKKDSIIDKIKQTLNISSEEEVKNKKSTKVESKKATSKSTAKKTPTKKATTTKKEATKRNVSKKETEKKAVTKKTTSKTTKKDNKSVSLDDNNKRTSTRSTAKKSTTKDSNKSATEKTKKSITKKATSTTAKRETSSKNKRASATSKLKTKKAPIKQIETPQIVEYYDLPYRYNQTLVKLLYQTPTTLFVYWDISDEDRERYKHIYGENFFEITKPVLIFHNITLNYSQELDINDFANSWYIHVNDSNCEYIVELGRRPIYYSAEIKEDYIYVSSSNNMIIPNDKILFNIDILDSLYFRNVKSGENKYIKLTELLKKVDSNGFPLINFNSLNELYKAIYGNENIEEIYNLNNPSSGNPSSGSLSSKFL